ncbi:FKBP-type peptidyl-prolyl cis-trans isomerase [Umboniibacter marinipuniceus]|uniref:Peptidyl-prolyl cis-trans isomerase n=1 Tax=Umboniibacter marinipuniceus TaxID=569599 RepID=A0A3M0ALZ8_9GAMM|nr:FKBP-type peptidyl-prolyl cis-trans isomerase [Umboniibacter marinipuniceus]RMA80002.1 FKBP-type peptidyl-prolyl cis-trans isomerase FklB [Umboniibacter marinipuniceus]
MTDFNTTEERVSYGIGRQMGDQLAQGAFKEVSLASVIAGITDAMEGNASAVPEAELSAAFQEIMARMEEEQKAASADVIAAGEKFLEENGQRLEVTVTESGLQYEVLTQGIGEKPSAESTVSCHYHGTLIDGTVFDSSVERGQPAEFPVSGVIAGWTEALQLMNVGSKYRLYVPSELAYGERGAGGAIGPYQTLVFDVELLAVV